jgi:hypothetical protein
MWCNQIARRRTLERRRNCPGQRVCPARLPSSKWSSGKWSQPWFGDQELWPQSKKPGAHAYRVPTSRSVSSEHGGFEPPTRCLPVKWCSFFWLRQRDFPSHRQHGCSRRCASLRRFLSGLVVNRVVKFSAWTWRPRGHAARVASLLIGRCRYRRAALARPSPSADLHACTAVCVMTTEDGG